MHDAPPPHGTRPGALPPLAEIEFDVGDTDDSLARLEDLAARHGPLFRIHAPGRKSDTWVINNPQDMKRVLVTNHRNYTKGVGLDRVKILLGNGIMVSEGERWRTQRRMLQPMFHRRMVENYARLIDRCIDERLERFSSLAAGGTVFDVTEEMSELTLDIVLRSIFGDDLEWLEQQLGENPFGILTEDPERNLQFAYKFRSLADIVQKLIDDRRRRGRDEPDLLGAMLAARDKDSGEPMADRDLIDETLTLVVAGHETTASALAFTWYLLARNPAAQARLQAELAASPELRPMTYQDTEELRYTRAVIEEAMRLYPPGWVLTRRSIAADELSGYPLPPGTDVILSPYVLQRTAAYFPEPTAFRPERFLGEEHPSENWTYIPFAAGPRHCIGENLAMYEMVVHVARVARRYEFILEDDRPLDLEAAINLRARNGIKMRLNRRADAPETAAPRRAPSQPLAEFRMQYQTLTEALEGNRRVPRAVHYLEGEHEERVVEYAELYERATGILYHLQSMGAGRGDKLIIFLNNNEQFLDGYWAAIAGGIVPVPLAVGISDEHRHKLLRIARKLGNPYLYTDRKNLDRLETFAASVGETATFEAMKRRAFLVDELDDISRAGRIVRAAPDDIAFIQFSSGSTSEPKGVVLTHRNILANCASAGGVSRFSADDVSLSWMPLTHDMGLIGFHLFMFCYRMQIYHMPTDLFIRRPLLWTTFASRYGATITSSPNFGYRHYLKVLGDRALADTDLSRIRLIYNGAEPISVELCDEFMSRMKHYGLRETAMFTVYGLAEATLAQSFPSPETGYRARSFDRHSLGVGATARTVPADSADALTLVTVGRAIPDAEIRIAAADRTAVADGIVGHLLIRGPNVTAGYYEAPDINAQMISADGWLDTGDLGVVADGDLYITGRAKEIIFVNGQNYYPHDIEAIAQNAAGLELGKVVAAGARPSGAESDELTLFVLHRGSMADFLPVANEVAALVNEKAGLEVRHVVPVKRIPKTTSGKIQRVALEEAFVNGEFTEELAVLAKLRGATAAAAPAAPASALAERLRVICEGALPGKRIEVDDNLFEIGASSLTLIQIHEEIDREFPGLVELTELFDHPTIAALARHLEAKLPAA
jgi:cytochrome P450/acyl-CoA synthetase (AMP-forming)/AMP-acid ligase II/aryl carrier-like protein